MRNVFVVGKLTNEKAKAWKIVGVFIKESDAVKACTTKKHFTGPMQMNKAHQKAQKWHGAWYPKLQPKPKVK